MVARVAGDMEGGKREESGLANYMGRPDVNVQSEPIERLKFTNQLKI